MDQFREGSASELILVATLGMFVLAVGVVFFFLAYQRRLLKEQKERQRVEAEYQQELLRSTVRSQERERNRIGKDLHDEVGAMLSTSRMYFRHLDQSTSAEKFDQLKGKVLGLFDDTLASVRRVSHDLRPPVLETLGLAEAVSGLVGHLNDTGDIKVTYQHNILVKLDKEFELAWYRIIQELIHNTIKHAQATEIGIQLKGDSTQLQVEYEDNGVGINSGYELKRGLGMQNIESRLNLMQGKMELINGGKGIHLLMSSGLTYTSTNAH